MLSLGIVRCAVSELTVSMLTVSDYLRTLDTARAGQTPGRRMLAARIEPRRTPHGWYVLVQAVLEVGRMRWSERVVGGREGRRRPVGSRCQDIRTIGDLGLFNFVIAIGSLTDRAIDRGAHRLELTPGTCVFRSYDHPQSSHFRKQARGDSATELHKLSWSLIKRPITSEGYAGKAEYRLVRSYNANAIFPRDSPYPSSFPPPLAATPSPDTPQKEISSGGLKTVCRGPRCEVWCIQL